MKNQYSEFLRKEADDWEKIGEILGYDGAADKKNQILKIGKFRKIATEIELLKNILTTIKNDPKLKEILKDSPILTLINQGLKT
jgi:hypothetical protein